MTHHEVVDKLAREIDPDAFNYNGVMPWSGKYSYGYFLSRRLRASLAAERVLRDRWWGFWL